MFCRVCGFRVWVWESYRTYRSFGYGYGSVTELTEGPGSAARSYRTHRSSRWVQKMLYPYHGYCGTGRTEFTEVPGGYKKYCTRTPLWDGAYRSHRSSVYGYECPAELTEVPGKGMKILQNFQKFRVLWHGRIELTEVAGRYVQKCCTRTPGIVARSYRSYRNSGQVRIKMYPYLVL